MSNIVKNRADAERLRLEASEAEASALLRIVRGSKDASAAETPLKRVMAALGAAEAKGSVCAKISDAVEQFSDLDPIFACGLATAPDQCRGQEPIVFEEAGDRMYLRCNYNAEYDLAQRLARCAMFPVSPVPPAVDAKINSIAQSDYARLGKGRPYPEFLADRARQDQAVRSAVARRISIICGGPGTGKTTTVVRILECLMLSEPKMEIVLAAPTGKAASRVMQSVRDAVRADAAVYPLMGAAIDEGRVGESTIHRLLITPCKDGNKPDARHPIDAGVLVVDEASMLEMGLAGELFAAVDPAKTRIIILGDRHQLAAVGPGSVLANLTDEQGALANLVTRLTVSHRFTSDSYIGQLAAAINAGDTERMQEVFNQSEAGGKDSVRLIASSSAGRLDVLARDWIRKSLSGYRDALRLVVQRGPAATQAEFLADFRSLWSEFNRSRALAAQRDGATGVDGLNLAAEEFVQEGTVGPARGGLYPGRAVIVRKNNSELGVYNGDVGIMLEDSGGTFQVYFGDTEKMLPAALLPEHDTAFAITIHQSQGSEYERVAVFLPHSADSGLATRELLYTGVTRAKASAEVFAPAGVLQKAAATSTERDGGLADRLLQACGGSVS